MERLRAKVQYIRISSVRVRNHDRRPTMFVLYTCKQTNVVTKKRPQPCKPNSVPMIATTQKLTNLSGSLPFFPALAIAPCLAGEHEYRLTKYLMSNYEKSVRPAKNAREPLVVLFDVSIHQIIDVDEKNQVSRHIILPSGSFLRPGSTLRILPVLTQFLDDK